MKGFIESKQLAFALRPCKDWKGLEYFTLLHNSFAGTAGRRLIQFSQGESRQAFSLLPFDKPGEERAKKSINLDRL